MDRTLARGIMYGFKYLDKITLL